MNPPSEVVLGESASPTTSQNRVSSELPQNGATDSLSPSPAIVALPVDPPIPISTPRVSIHEGPSGPTVHSSRASSTSYGGQTSILAKLRSFHDLRRARGTTPRPPSPIAEQEADVEEEENSTSESKGCCPSNGRNICVGFDGTLGEFGIMNSNVIEFHSRIIKDERQLANYISGIGTRGKSTIERKIDSAVATTFQSSVLMGYEWLCNQYEAGDRIFLFGFSRGAYQARVVAGMIDRVGLLYRGNNSQLPSVFRLYMETMEESSKSSSTTASSKQPPNESKESTGGTQQDNSMSTARKKCMIFKNAFSRPDVKVHFVGAWDTVSSIGIALRPCYPETVDGMTHVCHFRHALALDERRVRFWPEYANTRKPTPGGDCGDIKEVWFAGSHSDIGGGNAENLGLDKFGPALRWMTYEATLHGLRMKQFLNNWEDITPSMSLKGLWWNLLEILPLRRPSRKDGTLTTRVPHLGAPRRIHKGQYVHESVFRQMGFEIEPIHGTKGQTQDRVRNDDSAVKELPHSVITSHGTAGQQGSYRPQAVMYNTTAMWNNIPLLREMIEIDYFSSATAAVKTLRDALKENSGHVPAIKGLTPHILAAPRRKSLAEVPDILSLLLKSLSLIATHTDELSTNDSSSARWILYTALADVPSKPQDKLPVKDFRSYALQPRKIPAHIYQEVILRHGDGRLEGIPAGIHTELEYIAFSSNQDSILCGSYDEVVIWDCKTTRKRSIPYKQRARTVEISADGSQFVIGLEDGDIQLWDVAKEEVTRTFHGHNYGVTIVALSSDGKMASGSRDGSIRLWSLKGGEELHDPMYRHWGRILELAFNPGNTRLVSGGDDETVRVWDTGTGNHLMTLRGHTNSIWSVAYSQDGKYIISGSRDRTIRIWDAISGDWERTLTGHRSAIVCFALSKDGKLIASGGGDGDGFLRVWDASSGDAIAAFDVGTSIRSVAFSPDEKRLIVGCWGGKISIWDAELLL